MFVQQDYVSHENMIYYYVDVPGSSPLTTIWEADRELNVSKNISDIIKDIIRKAQNTDFLQMVFYTISSSMMPLKVTGMEFSRNTSKTKHSTLTLVGCWTLKNEIRKMKFLSFTVIISSK